MEITKVFVIIITYNGKQWYDRCLGSLRHSEIPVQVIVVDNASVDDTVEYIRTHFPEVHIIVSDVNLGFGQGNNKGLRYALENDADYVFLLNQDAWIEPNTINELVRIHKNNPEFGILSPMHLNADKNGIETGLLTYLNDNKVNNKNFINDLYFDSLKEIYDLKYINAACWLLPINTIEVIGGFDPLFFHYGEDDNYLNRTLYHGLKIGLCPKIRIVHDTERRVEKEMKATQTNEKSLLDPLVDVFDNKSVLSYSCYYFKKAVINFAKFKFEAAKKMINYAIYICRMSDQIEKNKAKNRTKGKNWIYES